MSLPFVTSALMTLAVCGCHAVNPIELIPFEPQIVHVWNGNECRKAVRTEKQLSQMQNLGLMVRRNGQIEPFFLYGDNVSPAVVDELWTRGGTIDLPNGEKLTLPPGTSVGQSEVRLAIKEHMERTGTISYPETFSGPLPEITRAK